VTDYSFEQSTAYKPITTTSITNSFIYAVVHSKCASASIIFLF